MLIRGISTIVQRKKKKRKGKEMFRMYLSDKLEFFVFIIRKTHRFDYLKVSIFKQKCVIHAKCLVFVPFLVILSCSDSPTGKTRVKDLKLPGIKYQVTLESLNRKIPKMIAFRQFEIELNVWLSL